MKRVAFVGNSVPRRCGIATFTTDLREAFAARSSSVDSFAIALTDRAGGYDYPPEVQLDIADQDLASYQEAARFLNRSGVDLVSLQHEFGIFGGPGGSHVLALLDSLQAPVVTTLHTVIREPRPLYRRILIEVARRSERLVVMSRTAVDYLTDIYGIQREKIAVIPHGIPDVPFDDPDHSARKRRLGVEGRTTMLTFGLLSPNKGIEQVIMALPAITERHPDIVYLVLGATHPNVKAQHGEAYRESLQALARDLGVERNVQFLDQFVSMDDLVDHLAAADLYVTPSLNPEQIVSGTLSYAVGSGKAVISTPYSYATELLADGRGRLAPFGESAPIAREVLDLLDDDAGRLAMRQKAYELGRSMVWPRVADQYHDLFLGVTARQQPRPAPSRRLEQPGQLPAVRLEHLARMTDSTGILQHAIYTVPNYAEGYTTDDNVRALSVVLRYDAESQEPSPLAQALAERYVAFLSYAYNPAAGGFRNFLGYNRTWLEEIGSEDSQARALESLGLLSGYPRWEPLRRIAGRLFALAFPAAERFTAPRAWAHTILGLAHSLSKGEHDPAKTGLLRTLADRLDAEFQAHRRTNWQWFEDVLTYENAVLPHALLVAGERLDRPDLIATGLSSLAWLGLVQQPDGGHFVPVGSDFPYRRGGERPRYDQQPLEAAATVSACLAAHRITRAAHWREDAEVAFRWFHGANDGELSLYDDESGGCFDGLRPGRVNRNQGAESLLAYLQASLEIRAAGLPATRTTHSSPALAGATAGLFGNGLVGA